MCSEREGRRWNWGLAVAAARFLHRLGCLEALAFIEAIHEAMLADMARASEDYDAIKESVYQRCMELVAREAGR